MIIVIQNKEELAIAEQYGITFERTPPLPFVLDTDAFEGIGRGLAEHIDDHRAAHQPQLVEC